MYQESLGVLPAAAVAGSVGAPTPPPPPPAPGSPRRQLITPAGNRAPVFVQLAPTQLAQYSQKHQLRQIQQRRKLLVERTDKCRIDCDHAGPLFVPVCACSSLALTSATSQVSCSSCSAVVSTALDFSQFTSIGYDWQDFYESASELQYALTGARQRDGVLIPSHATTLPSSSTTTGRASRSLELLTSADDMESTSDEQSSSCSSRQTDCRTLVQEARADCDHIRFAAYRCAAKLRHIQKRTNLHLIDICNVIEALRESGISVLTADAQLPVSRLDSLLTMLTLAVNKRLPLSRQVNLDAVVNTVLSLLLSVYDSDEIGSVRVFAVKVALSTLCSGQLTDKLRYVFSQLSDTQGNLVMSRFADYLRCVLALPAAVYESASFFYSDNFVHNVFSSTQVDVNEFLTCLVAESRVECLLWLPVLYRMSLVESVFHSVTCAGCEQSGFAGFCYLCDRCTNYHLCQQCFWRGTTSGAHTLQHSMQELSSPKTVADSMLRTSRHPALGRAPAALVAGTRLSTAMTGHPPSQHFNSALGDGVLENDNADVNFANLQAGRLGRLMRGEQDFAAQFTSHLPQDTPHGRTCSSDSGSEMALGSGDRDTLVAQIENKNFEMFRQIAQMRSGVVDGGDAVSELTALRERRGQLECQLNCLHDSRRQLMNQLDALMTLLKTQHLSSSGLVCIGASPLSFAETASPPPPADSASGQIYSSSADAAYRTAGSKSAPNTPATTLRRAGIHQQQSQPVVSGGKGGSGGCAGEDSGLEDPFTQSLSSPDWTDTSRWQPR